MPAITISLPQMVDLALATPALGGMNLGILHSLMQIVVQKLGLSDCRVEFHGEQSDVFETLVSRMPKKPIVKVEEFVIDPSDAMRRNPVSKDVENVQHRHIFTVNQQEIVEGLTKQIPPGFPLQPIHIFDDEELANQSTHDRVGPILPKPEDLLHEPEGDENAIFDMFKMLNLEKRLEAVEEALKNSGAMSATIAKANDIKKTSEYIDGYKNLISELLERVGNVEQALTAISVAPMRPSLEYDYVQMKSNKSGYSARSRGESLRPSGTLPMLHYSKNLEPGQLKFTSNVPEGFLSNFEELEQIIKGQVKNIFCSDDFMFEDCQLLTRVKNKLGDELRNQLLETVNNYMGKAGNTDYGSQASKDVHQSVGVAEYRKKWFRIYPKLDSLESSPYQVSNRIENYDEIVRRMLSDELFLDLFAKQLAVQCHCPVDIAKVKDIQEITHRLSLLEKHFEDFHSSAKDRSWKHFKDTLIKLRDDIPAIKDDYAQFRAVFLKTMREVQDILDSKVDKYHIPTIKHFVVSEIDKMQFTLDTLLSKKPAPEAAIGSFSLLKDLKCVSCRTEVCMKDQLYPANVPKYPKAPQSKVIHSFETPPTTRSCLKSQSNRFCGGRFTLTKPEDRLWRSGHFFDQFNVLPPSQDVILAEGMSGRMFRVDPPKSECVCLDPVAHEKKSMQE